MRARCIREEFTKEYRGIVIDDRALYEEVKAYVEAIAPELADRVEFYDRPRRRACRSSSGSTSTSSC